MLDAVHTHLVPLAGYEVKRPCDVEELLRRAKTGI
jgi:hypothetical protein